MASVVMASMGLLEKDRIDGGLVVEGDGGDRLGQGEDDVEVRDRQQFALSILQPFAFAPRPGHFGQCRSRHEL